MHNKLTEILLQKQQEVASLYAGLPSFKSALQSKALAVIAEVKRSSPSKGMLAPIKNPLELVEQYIAGGANAISVLTDQTFFGGSLLDLQQIAAYARQYNIPVLRKDFIIDPIQITEAANAGASAVLLIVAVLGERTKALLEFARTLRLDVIVEVHDAVELQIALQADADIIGINNRNLKTFIVDPEHSLKMLQLIPDNIIKIAESGIKEPSLAKAYYAAGFDAVLIGEALVKSANPQEFIARCRDA